MVSKGYFIQYKFILPENTRHSSYSYQKLFSALYGYTQNVSKSNGKTYTYHRPGVLSGVPHIRPGKNCVIVPKESFQSLLSFFKTGSNPTHKWKSKGDWKAVYYMDEKELNDEEIVKALNEFVDNFYVPSPEGVHSKIADELSILSDAKKANSNYDQSHAKSVLEEAQKILLHPWFSEHKNKSQKLIDFASRVYALR